MRKRSRNTRNYGARPRAWLSTKALALVATFSLVMSMCPGVVAY